MKAILVLSSLLSLALAVPKPSATIDGTATCTCEPMFCPQVWPQSCYCENQNKLDCYNKCGGAHPVLQPCPTLPPSPTKAHKYRRCGFGKPCPKGLDCIDIPNHKGCGLACDQPGICVNFKKTETCGGFPGIACPRGKRCADDPRDDCDPKNGGADCPGICLWKSAWKTGL